MAGKQEMEQSWDEELRESLRSIFGSSENVIAAFHVAKTKSSWSLGGLRTRSSSKQRILAFTVKPSTVRKRIAVRMQVVKDSATGLKTEKVYKLGHLSKIEGVLDDKSGCTLILHFDLLQNQSGPPPQWMVRGVDDRNRLITTISKLCKEYHGRAPKISGVDVVEIQLWAQRNAKIAPEKAPIIVEEDTDDEGYEETADTTTLENEELVSKEEEEDVDALLGMYLLGIDEAAAFSDRLKRDIQSLHDANVYAILESQPLVDEVMEKLDVAMGNLEDTEQWLGDINVNLLCMREGVASIESGNNTLETQALNSAALLNELNRVSDRFRLPPEGANQYAEILRGGTFDEARVAQTIEACEWLASALHDLQPPFLDSTYVSMRAIRERRTELEKLKNVFLGRATSFLRDHFSNIVDSMMKDKAAFSQKGQLNKPDHADLRYRCRTYARMIQHMKILDKNFLIPLRKSFCLSLNLLLRREVREFANELRSSTVVKQTTGALLDRLGSGAGQLSPSAGSAVSDAYARMLRTFVPYLVDESSFFASFMCFEVQSFTPEVNPDDGKDDDKEEVRATDMDVMEPKTPDQEAMESKALKEALQELLNGIQEDFYAVVDWAHRLDPWSCILMQGVTERYLSGQKADAAWFVRLLLKDMQDRICTHFKQVVTETNKQFERADRSQTGILFSIHKFANLAALMEAQIGQNSRDVIDGAYKILVTTIFTAIETSAKNEPKNPEVFVLGNYAAFQDKIYDLANVTPALQTFYNEAGDAYEQACQQFVQTMINYMLGDSDARCIESSILFFQQISSVHQFERLFMFGQKLDNLLISVEPEQIPSMVGFTKADLRRTLKASLSGVEKALQATYKRMQKSVQREDIVSTLWDKYFKTVFLDQYKSLEETLLKCYKEEPLTVSFTEMEEILDRTHSPNE